MDADVRQLTRLAERTARQLEARARRASPPRGLTRGLRVALWARQGLVRKAKTLLREHWDLAAFDLLFGCLKAFGVYPALYFAGMAWAIPLMESALLNTQLWTAGYVVVRAKLLSQLGRLRYGHPLEQLDALGNRLLGLAPGDPRDVHRFQLGGHSRLLRVRRSRMRDWLARWRGERAGGVVSQSALRAWLDPELRHLANPLRANPYFYERVLLANLLATPEARARLLEASVPDEPPTGEARALRAALGEVPMAALARLTQQSEALADALRSRLDRTPIARCLRWIHASLVRAVRARLRELEDLRYRLLADRIEGRALHDSPHWGALCRKRAEIRACVARAGSFARRASHLSSEAEARRFAGRTLRDARARGFAMRRARAAGWLAAAGEAWQPLALPARGPQA